MIFQTKKSVLASLAIGFWLASSAQTSVNEVPKGWHLKDLNSDGLYGISLDKAYDFLKNKKSNTVIVAVIDSGIDTLHEDLKPVLWTNPKEIPGNGKDDDKNGYVDDVHGWNFIGGKDGRNVKEDSYEAARVYHKFKAKFENVSDTASLSKEDLYTYKMWKKAEKQVTGGGKESGLELLILKRTFQAAVKNDTILQKAIGKPTYSGRDLEAFTPTTDEQKKAKTSLLIFFTSNNVMDMTNTALMDDFKNYLDSEEKKAEAADKAPKDYRGEIVKDNYDDFNDRYYGNNDVMANTPFHGTHVSGIIAAARNNGKGIDGIANNVKIMAVRAVPDGDEHDKDVALAIRYAVDNGAKVINMSFGKGFSPEKQWVDDAVKYAASKGVLLVHAAGNDAANVDSVENYPNPLFKDESGKAANWITVGASGDPKAGGLVASFSNYGKKEVDVFAPGVKIYSSIPGGNTYGDAQGTSMASPVVAGVAALILSYYPNLTPQQVKSVIENSAVKTDLKVVSPGSDESVSLSDLSVTGGILNAFEAVKLADSISSGKSQPAKANQPKAQKAMK
ncbi:S8 family peptidase [Chitinophagaceae bacterium LB-8]|uniref:S8 family peptidase n=1 Tax=Paraflavisolibacter caeni TaxID=2982496 RepID=A0A9X3B9K5_9BACT|nr:S8 family peptidase [Paraflavisolibacter caeni]MCU7552170.1 S8 family peptidase [Paraflavisolibacter caeni]